MDCTEARARLLDHRRGRLPADEGAAVARHLASCDGCRREDEAEATLDRLLVARLPREEVPARLRARLARLASGAGAEPARRSGLALQVAAATVGAALLGAAGALLLERLPSRGEAADRLVSEVVTDHLRMLAAARPPEVSSGKTHEVKPWFEGRLDFAPAVPGDRGELRLVGGSVGYVLDRKAAVIAYALRRHQVTLLGFPAAGLPWPNPSVDAGGVPVSRASIRGFEIALWRHGEVGYALVSDVGAGDLTAIARELAPATAP